MNWPVVMKIAVSALAVAMASFSTTYSTNPATTVVAYAAAICGSLGSYLLGLFQSSPTKEA